MARASTRTLLPLDRFAALLGWNPIHFNQVLTAAMPQTICGNPTKQYAWQESNAVGREDLAFAIAEAERMLRDQIGYSLLPDWTVDERLPTVTPAIPSLINLTGRNLYGYRNTVQLSNGYYISGGIEAWDIIEAGATVVYTDADGDGYDETATVTVNIPAAGNDAHTTDVEEIAVVFPGEDATSAPLWEVRPLRSVSITAGVATIVFYRQQVPLPELWEALVPTAIDGDVDANFLDEVDVWRHWNNPEQQVQALWSPLNGWDCGCLQDTCTACTDASQYGCLLGNDYRLGIVHFQPSEWNATTASFGDRAYAVARQPDRLRLWYRSGFQDTRAKWPKLQMDGTWERAVAYLAITLLDRECCACDNVTALTGHWREDLSMNDSTQAGSRSFNLSGQGRLLENPFGTTRGAVYAWQRAVAGERTIGRAVKF
jgi:hypothetical protein